MNTKHLRGSAAGLGRYFYPAVFLASCIYVLILIGNYDINWVHPEVVKIQLPGVVRNGVEIVPWDLLRGFDVQSFEYGGRSRFVSYFFQTFNIKLRLLLLRFIPPHPSFSLTWVFTLLLGPILIFRLIRELSGEREAAWTGAALFLLSTGTLSGVTMLFHPAKPLALFLALLCYYLAVRMARTSQSDGYFSPAYNRRLIVLLVLLLAACFTDEAAWFIFVCLAVGVPGLYRERRKGLITVGLYAGVFAGFLIFVTWAAPVITRNLFGQKNFDFWRMALTRGDHSVLVDYSVLHTIRIVRDVIMNQLAPVSRLGRLLTPTRIIVLSILTPYLVWSFIRQSPARRRLTLRLAAVLLLYLAYQSIIIEKRGRATITTSYYYGNLTAIFSTLSLALILSAPREPDRTLGKWALVLLLVIYACNFRMVNRHWLDSHEARARSISAKYFPRQALRMRGKSLTREMVREAWRYRREPEVIQQLQPGFPLKALWLFAELERVYPPEGDRGYNAAGELRR